MPTHDRVDHLACCLTALERQEGGVSQEIVVVDDASARDGRVADVVAQVPAARLIRHDTKSGPAAARNAGGRATRGDFVCFTDDDCIPAADWVTRLVSVLRSGQADVVGGVTWSAERDHPVAMASQTITDHVVQHGLEPSRRARFLPSNNLGCRRELLTAVPFDEGYPFPAGEDRDWCARLVARGCRLVLEPSAVVLHRQEVALHDFLRRHFRYGRGAYRFRRTHREGRSIESSQFYVKLLRRGFRGGLATGSLVGLAQIATAAGFLTDVVANSRSVDD